MRVEAPDDRGFRRSGAKRALLLVSIVLVALSAVILVFMKRQSDWEAVKARHLIFAEHAAKQRGSLEAQIATTPPGILREWLSEYARHFRDMETRRRAAALKPGEPLPPDPPEPDPPTFQELWKSAADEAKEEM